MVFFFSKQVICQSIQSVAKLGKPFYWMKTSNFTNQSERYPSIFQLLLFDQLLSS